ncbi:MAG: biotin--[acetyl-CoA-carboxylase] ligase [Calditrichaeota bacterium]|nr:biotin--[acetyl-CoA-carboxylase] ligase [Calditrichota bacterium]
MKYGTSTAGAFNYHYFKEVGSTNDTLAELARQNAPEWTVVLADHQTNGRGRYRRSWHSPAGLGMWLSLLLRPAFDNRQLNFINLLAANTMATVLEQLATTVQQQMVTGLKWPNDVWVGDKKICGILPESSFSGQKLQYIIVGIGLNINQSLSDFSEDLQPFATSLKIETGREWPVKLLATRFLDLFRQQYSEFIPNQTGKILDEYRKKMLFKNETVNLFLNDQTFSAVVRDIDDDGFLEVDHDGKTKIINSGEFRVQPVRIN